MDPFIDIKEEALQQVLTALSRLPNWQDKVEVLANVFMIYGVDAMSHTSNLPDKVTPENVVSLVLDDVEKHGNTVANSLAMQGITILEWLSRDEQEK